MKTRLKELRKRNNLSLRELDEKVNINYSQLARIERGESFLSQQHIKVLSEFFGVSSDYLLCLSDNEKFVLKENTFKPIPIITSLVNGKFNLKDSIGYLTADVDIKENYIYFKIDDDSMSPTFYDGDYVLINLKKEPENNDLVLVGTIDKNAFIRRYRKTNNELMLLPDNNLYDPLIVKNNSTIIITGVVYGFYRPHLRNEQIKWYYKKLILLINKKSGNYPDFFT
ncbi:LexA repressor [Haploplasma axanthum]|uniref:LexA repressor n=2 Tax=Haploplasma axanthum TaxID=29552 RepID=A0A449BC60_HAPAX|nr:LexA repressor [Haploplasma axanthum]